MLNSCWSIHMWSMWWMMTRSEVSSLKHSSQMIPLYIRYVILYVICDVNADDVSLVILAVVNTIHTIHTILCIAYYTLYILYYTMHTILYAIHTILYITYYTLHTMYTMHYIYYTYYAILCILHAICWCAWSSFCWIWSDDGSLDWFDDLMVFLIWGGGRKKEAMIFLKKETKTPFSLVSSSPNSATLLVSRSQLRPSLTGCAWARPGSLVDSSLSLSRGRSLRSLHAQFVLRER